MFRIRRVYDDTTPADKDAIAQVKDILRAQFPSSHNFLTFKAKHKGGGSPRSLAQSIHFFTVSDVIT